MGSKRTRKTYSIDFKREIVNRIESGQITQSAAAREYKVSPAAIGQWRAKLAEGALVEKPSKRERELEKELEKYKIRMAELQMENDFLKKAEELIQRKRKLESAVITEANLNQYKKGSK